MWQVTWQTTCVAAYLLFLKERNRAGPMAAISVFFALFLATTPGCAATRAGKSHHATWWFEGCRSNFGHSGFRRTAISELHTPASKIRAWPHAAQQPAYRGPVFGPAFAWRHRRAFDAAFVWFSVLRFELGVPNPTTFLAPHQVFYVKSVPVNGVTRRHTDPPPCAPTNGRPGFPFGFLGAGGRLPKARRGRFFIV